VIAEKSGETIAAMVPLIEKTSALVKEISASSSEQSTGIREVGRTMTQLDKVSQGNSTSSEELASTSQEMQTQTDQLIATVEYFKT
jgi:methyl-accepting chemotaxis protein